MSTWLQPEPSNWMDIVEDALEEDIGSGDLTSGCVDSEQIVQWRIDAQADGYLCGAGIAEYLLMPFNGDPDETKIQVERSDGDSIQRGETIMYGTMSARRALMVERTALNFIMFLSGVATLTAQYVERIAGTNARIVDTRKTVPGFRTMQKYAVRCGGGYNHRMGLYDGVMIKDNHIQAAGGIAEAVQTVRGYVSHMMKIEVECETIEHVDQAVAAGAEIILLDNMDPFMMREAVQKYKGRCLFEASGSISLDTVRGVANTGVDLISVGAITHSAVSLPFHLEIE